MNDFVTSPGFVIGISIGIGIAATQACMGIAAWLMPPKPCPNCASPIYQWYHYLSIGSGAGLSLTQAFHFSGTCAKCSPDQAVPNASKAPLGWALVGLVIAAAAGWLWWASTQSSNEPAWYLNRGVSRGKEGDLDGAVADFTKAIDLDPRLALAYFNRGEVLIQKGNFDAAIADFTKAIELNPRYGEAYGDRGAARLSRGDPDGAIADCTRAIDLNPGHALPYQNRAAAFHEKGDFEAAIADATKSIDLKPNGDVYFNRGLARAATNDLDGAIADYTEAVRLKPGLAMAYLHRGEVLLFQFKDAEAQKDFDRCLKLQPNLNPDMARVIDNAKQARGEKR